MPARLKYNARTGEFIDIATGWHVGFMSRASHEQDPALGERMAAALEMLDLLRECLPSLNSLVAQECPEPDVAAADLELRDKVKALLARLEP